MQSRLLDIVLEELAALDEDCLTKIIVGKIVMKEALRRDPRTNS